MGLVVGFIIRHHLYHLHVMRCIDHISRVSKWVSEWAPLTIELFMGQRSHNDDVLVPKTLSFHPSTQSFFNVVDDGGYLVQWLAQLPSVGKVRVWFISLKMLDNIHRRTLQDSILLKKKMHYWVISAIRAKSMLQCCGWVQTNQIDPGIDLESIFHELKDKESIFTLNPSQIEMRFGCKEGR